jgi:hypothetical protein
MRHIKVQHVAHRPFKCPECDRKFGRLDNMKEHRGSEEPVRCTERGGRPLTMKWEEWKLVDSLLLLWFVTSNWHLHQTIITSKLLMWKQPLLVTNHSNKSESTSCATCCTLIWRIKDAWLLNVSRCDVLRDLQPSQRHPSNYHNVEVADVEATSTRHEPQQQE